MAAATVVIKALPPNRTMTMYIDSMATIQTLRQGPVSERKRIKMQGRPGLEIIPQANTN